MKQNLAEPWGEIGKFKIIVGEFNITISIFDRISTQKIIKEREDLNVPINQLGLIDIYRSLNPTKEKCILFSSTPGTFTKIDHILGHQ